ncbi:MAG: hypothetical protein ABIX10_10645 [Acidimicrobiales bacterium]
MPHDSDVLVDGSLVEPVVAALTAEVSLAPQSLIRFTELIRRFGRFIAFTYEVEDLRAVTPSMTAAFVRSPSSDGPPTSSVVHLRRTAVRVCFRVARDLGLADGDPTLDLELPAREPGSLSPLTDEEVTLCRFASVASLDETRLPAAWALVEATARTAELHLITGAEVDLVAGRVWLPGAARVSARWGLLSPWGRLQIERRVRAIGDPAAPLTYAGKGSAHSRQAASCISISSTFARAGLSDDPGIRPLSVTAWAGRQILDECGRIEVVAQRLGNRSLDRTARLIGLDWAAGSL